MFGINNEFHTEELKTGLIKLEQSGITDAYECNNFVILSCSSKIVYGWITYVKLF